MVDVQHSGITIPFHCTDVMTCEHLKNHFSKCLNDKIYNTFKDLFSNVNIESIQETYLKSNIYNNTIAQFLEKTNLKYRLDLTFTMLEALEVGLLAKTFQIVGHHEDNHASGQQLPSQHLQPPQQALHKHAPPQPHQAKELEVVATALLVDTLHHNIQWVEID